MDIVLTIFMVIGALVTLLVAAVVLGLVWVRRRQAKGLALQEAERHQYPEWAAEHGLRYDEEDDAWLRPLAAHRPFSDFDPNAGSFNQVLHVFGRSSDDRPAAFLQLTVSADPRPGARPSGYLTVAASRLPERFPETMIAPRGRSDPPPNVDPVPGSAAFEAAYTIRTVDPTRTRAMFDEELVAWMLDLPAKERPVLHLKGRWATCFLGGPLSFERGKRVFDTLDGFVQRLGTGEGTPS